MTDPSPATGDASTPRAAPTLRLSTRRVTRVILLAIVALLAAHIAVLVVRHGFGHPYVHGLAWRFDFDREGNVPTLFSALILFATALVTAATAFVAGPGGRPDRRWWGFAAAFLYLGFDEGAQLHELVTGWIRREVFSVEPLGIAVAALAVAALVVALVWFGGLFRDLPDRVRNRCLVAAGVFLVSAVGLELVGWKVWETRGIESLPFSILATIEETGEMLAGALFLRAFLDHLAERTDRLIVELG